MTFTVYYLHLLNSFSLLIVYYLCIDIFEGSVSSLTNLQKKVTDPTSFF